MLGPNPNGDNRYVTFCDQTRLIIRGNLVTKQSVFLLTAFLVAAHPIRGQQTCHAADINSAHFIKTLVAMMDTSRATLRTSLQLPLVSPSSITLVSNATVCSKAGLAADSIFKVWEPTATLPPTTDPIYVIQVGTSYAVADLNDPDDSDGDWVSIFGPLWEYRGSILAR